MGKGDDDPINYNTSRLSANATTPPYKYHGRRCQDQPSQHQHHQDLISRILTTTSQTARLMAMTPTIWTINHPRRRHLNIRHSPCSPIASLNVDPRLSYSICLRLCLRLYLRLCLCLYLRHSLYYCLYLCLRRRRRPTPTHPASVRRA